MKKLILSIIISLTMLVSSVSAEYFRDVIVSGKTAIWTDSRAYSSLADAVAAIGTINEQTLVVKQTENITSDLTIPPNITLEVASGGMLNRSVGVTLTIGRFSAGQYQVFSGDGLTKFSDGAVDGTWLEWYGGKTDGTTDNYDAFVDALSSYDTVRFLDGVYYVSSPVSKSNTDISLLGSGNTKITTDYDTSSSYLFTFDSTIVTQTTVNSAPVATDESFTVTDATGIVAGQVFILISSEQWYDQADYQKGETNRVLSVSGTTINCERPLEFSYNGGGETVFAKFYDPYKIDIHNIDFEHTSPTTDSHNNNLLQVFGRSGVTISNCTVKDFVTKAFLIEGSYDSSVTDCSFNGINAAGLGYCTMFQGCTMFSVENCKSYNCRTLFDAGGHDYAGSSVLATGPSLYGTLQGSFIDNCQKGLGTHAGAVNISFIGNYVSNASVGAYFRGRAISYIGNIFKNCTYLARIYWDYTYGEFCDNIYLRTSDFFPAAIFQISTNWDPDYGILVKNNVLGWGGYGFHFDTGLAETYERLVVENNEILYLEDQSGTYPETYIFRSTLASVLSNSIVKGNRIINELNTDASSGFSEDVTFDSSCRIPDYEDYYKWSHHFAGAIDIGEQYRIRLSFPRGKETYVGELTVIGSSGSTTNAAGYGSAKVGLHFAFKVGSLIESVITAVYENTITTANISVTYVSDYVADIIVTHPGVVDFARFSADIELRSTWILNRYIGISAEVIE